MEGVLVAALAILLHVVNYNVRGIERRPKHPPGVASAATAHIEHHTRCFTKLLGRNAVYYYAVYLVASALVRDHFINVAVEGTKSSLPLLPGGLSSPVGLALFGAGIALNLWTLQALGIKGMYNGDSFGHLMDAPVTGGPFAYLSDPQYVGTTLAAFGWALHLESAAGYALAAWMGVVFWASARFVEAPHMIRLYSSKDKGKKI
eukprot:tig00001127_g7138.t1